MILVDPDLSFSLNFDIPALRRLIKRAFALHELSSLIETVFSSTDADDAIRCLCVDDAQTFVDVIDEVRYSLSTQNLGD